MTVTLLASCASGASVRVADTTTASWIGATVERDPDVLAAGGRWR